MIFLDTNDPLLSILIHFTDPVGAMNDSLIFNVAIFKSFTCMW